MPDERSASVLQTQGNHSARIKNLEDHKKEAVDPAITQLHLLTENNRTTTELLKEISDDLKKMREKQITCIAERAQAAKLDTSGLNKLQKVGVWTVILAFIGSVFSGAAVALYKVMQHMIDSVANGHAPH